MNSRNRLLLGLIKDKNIDTETFMDQAQQAKAQEVAVPEPMVAPEPEEEVKTPQQEFKEIIKLANKKVNGQKKKMKLKNKVIDKLLGFMEEQYVPITIDEADIF